MRRAPLALLALLALGVSAQATTPGSFLVLLRKGKALPVNLSLPTVSPSSPLVGVAESASNGAWSQFPTSYTYQWEWFDTTANIAGAISQSYTPVVGDIGHTLAIKVTATNAKGSATAISLPTSAVAPAPCSNSLNFSTACNSQYVGLIE